MFGLMFTNRRYFSQLPLEQISKNNSVSKDENAIKIDKTELSDLGTKLEAKSDANLDVKSETYKEYLYKLFSEYQKDAHQFSSDFGEVLSDFERKRYSITKLKYMGITIAVLFLFMFWRTIKSFLSKETSDVAVRTMNDEEFKKHVYKTVLDIFENVRNDQIAIDKLADLITNSLGGVVKDQRTSDALHDPTFVSYLVSVTSEIIKSEQTKKDVDKLTADAIEVILKDEKNKKMLADAIYEAMCDAWSRFKSGFKPW